MRIGINALALTKPKTRAGQYAHAIITELQMKDRDNSYVLFVPEKPKMSLKNNFEYVIVPLDPASPNINAYRWERKDLARAAEEAHVDILHSFSPACVRQKTIPKTIMVHDSGLWEGQQRTFLEKYLLRRDLRCADAVITTTDSLRKAVSRRYGLSLDRIRVVRNGYSDVFTKMPALDAVKKAKEKFELSEDFFLHVGQFRRQGNTEQILKALAQLSKKMNNSYIQLILAGRARFQATSDYYSKNEIQRMLKAFNVTSKVSMTGPVSQEQLNVLYHLSRGLVCSSTTIHFPQVALESMRAATPVIAPDASMFHDVLKDAGLYYDDQDAESLVEMLEKALVDPDSLRGIVQKALSRTTEFSWEKSADQLLREWKDLVENNVKIK